MSANILLQLSWKTGFECFAFVSGGTLCSAESVLSREQGEQRRIKALYAVIISPR